MGSLRILRLFWVALCALLISFPRTGKSLPQASCLEDFFSNFRNAIEARDEKSIASFYDQTQAEFLKSEMTKWRNIFYMASPKDLKVEFFSIGGEGGEQIVMYELISSDALFNMLFSVTIRPYALRKTKAGWKFYKDMPISQLYAPMAEEINVAISPLAREMKAVQKVKIKSTREKVASIVFIINDELRVDSCSEKGKKLGFEQFGYLLRIDRPLKRSGEQLELRVKYGGKVEKYQMLNDHYISETGGILRSENFWHLSPASYEEHLPRPIKLTIDLPEDFNAVSDGGRLAFSKKEGKRLVQRWDIPPDDSLFVGFIFFNGWKIKDYNTGINRLYLCLDKNSKLEVKTIVESVVDIINFYKQMFGVIPLRDYYILEYDFGFCRNNYVPAKTKILPHELSHLWWSFPGEVWLSEGFAEYSDALNLERTKGHTVLQKRLQALKQEMIQIMEGGLDVPLAGSGYNQLIYTKGALVVQALRLELGDSLFFKTLKNFISKYHNKNVTWKDLCHIAEVTSGRNLGFFFEQWVLRSGLPNLDLEYETTPNGKDFKIKGKVMQKGSLYRLSSKLEISGQGLKEAHELLLDKTETPFTFLVSFKPETIDLNVGEGLPCIIKASGLSAKKGILESEGIKALNKHDYKKALENYTELVKLPLEQEEKALASYQMGKILFGLGKYAEAAEQFKQAVSFTDLPQDYRYAAILYLGKSSLCAGKRELAQEYFRQLVSPPEVPEYYKTEASRLSQYLGLVTPPQEETIRLVKELQKAINEKNEAELKIFAERLPKDKKAGIESFGKIPISNFRIEIELVLNAGDDEYYVECYAIGTLGERVLGGDFIILTHQANKEAKLIDVIRIQMN